MSCNTTLDCSGGYIFLSIVTDEILKRKLRKLVVAQNELWI